MELPEQMATTIERATPAADAPATGRQATPAAAREQCAAYDRALEACEHALTSRPELVFESFFIFGGQRVRMRVVGRELSQHLTRPFAHLRTARDDSAAAALTIDVWDERESHVPYPAGGYPDPTETFWPAGNGILAVSAATRYVRYDCTAWVTWIDRAARRIIGWRSNADRVSMHERTRPLPFLLPIWYADSGVDVIHAGLVARDDKGLLFCGSNGAGKSTSSLASLCGGLDFLSDDHVGLEERANGSFVGHSVFGSTRLEPNHLTNFPQLIEHAIPSFEWYETKSLILVAEAMPLRVKPSVPIRAIALPAIVDKPRGRILPASRAEALRAIAPSTLMQMPFGATPNRFTKLSRLALSVPAFRLELGRDFDGIASRVGELLDGLA